MRKRDTVYAIITPTLAVTVSPRRARYFTRIEEFGSQRNFRLR